MIGSIEGVGIDTVHIPRIEKMIEEYGEKFLNKVFTANEQEYAKKKAKGDPRIFASTLAKRWAAKEATVKALGTGFGSGIHWNDIDIINIENSAPTIQIQGLSDNKPYRKYQLSMSDDYPNAVAFVIITR
jgi:holo-[acyl-carrier protein] synthase